MHLRRIYAGKRNNAFWVICNFEASLEILATYELEIYPDLFCTSMPKEKVNKKLKTLPNFSFNIKYTCLKIHMYAKYIKFTYA